MHFNFYSKFSESVSTPISERYSEIPLSQQHTERITLSSHLNLNTHHNSCSTKTLSRNAVVPTQKPYFKTRIASLHNQVISISFSNKQSDIH